MWFEEINAILKEKKVETKMFLISMLEFLFKNITNNESTVTS